LQEFGRPLPQDPKALAALIKALPVKHAGLRPMDEAISTAGGVDWSALNADLMLTKIPGTFCAGEMLDWEAPTGGYLLTACFATGRWAGQGAVRYLAAG
jgi:predicted flavoprotein YhiN